MSKRISKIIPSFLVDKASCTRQFESELSLHSLASLFPIKEGIFLPLRLSCKESSTFLTKPLFPQEREDVTALRCSGPLRSKVGGASKPCARLCGMGPLGDNSHQKLARLGGMGPLGDSRGVIPIIWHPPIRYIPKPSRGLRCQLASSGDSALA